MPSRISRVYGPYKNGAKWRIVVYEGERRTSLTFNTLEEAEIVKTRLLAMLADRPEMSVESALEEYLAEKERDGVRSASIGMLRYKLRQFLPLDTALAGISPQQAARLYLDETKRIGRFGNVISAATHRALLRSAKAFFRWAVERQYVRVNPFDGVRPIGKVNAGKSQLRLDEARRLTEFLMQRAENDDEGALAVLVQVIMGMRSSEVLRLQVRDVDSEGREIWVDGTKTKNARRPLAVESVPLQHLLVRHCAGRKGEELLFGAGRSKPHFSDFLWHRVRKYCALAGVPVVCPHSLRGLHSSLAMARGASSRFVAEALGHGSDEVTKRHYIDPTAAKNASIKRVADALTSKRATPADKLPSADLAALAAALQSLDPEQLKALLSSVPERR